MTKHFKYLRYIVRHKWFVFWAGISLHVPFWQLVFHDWHKFTPTEWIPYVNYFYGNGDKRKTTTQYDPTNTGDAAFDYSWLSHQNRGKHHWQHWILVRDDGDTRVLPMPEKYAREMVADWSGAGRALGHGNDVVPWYRKNKDKMQLHPDTRVLVEELVRQTSAWFPGNVSGTPI